MTTIIDGRIIARTIKEKLSRQTLDLISRNIVPRMAVVHVGEDPASLSYTKSIKRISSKLKIEVEIFKIGEIEGDDSVINTIETLNKDKEINGIIVQEPIPARFNRNAILLAISPSKDIDCMNPVNLGRIIRGEFLFAPSTALGVLKILENEDIEVEGKHVVIVGRSTVVGRPLANLLLIKGKGGNATVTVCHSRTKNLTYFTKMADILIVAIGKPRLIKGDMVKEGAVVIDVGINDIEEKDGKHRLVGDVDTVSVMGIASYITPVPGGVGPVTTMMLLSNLIKATEEMVKG